MTKQGKIREPDRVFNAKAFLRLEPGGPKPKARQVALVPGERVAVMGLDLPQGVQGAAREKVARRQVADMTGQAAEALDVRPFHEGKEPKRWNRVLVAGTGDVAAWRKQAGTGCKAVLPDYLGLPVAEGLWTVAAEPEAVMVRLGLTDGFSARPGMVLPLMQRAWAEIAGAERPKAILSLGTAVPGLADWAAEAGVPVVSDAGALGKLGVASPKVLAHGETGFDLRKDAQAARAKLRARVLPWRWPVLAGLAAAAIWGAGQILATQRLEEQRRDLVAASMEIVRDHFVPEGPILDIRAQVGRAMAERQANGPATVRKAGPLEVFGAASEVLAAQKAKIGLVDYNAAQGLELTVVTVDFAALDAVVAALDEAGMRVEVAQSRNVAEGAEARMKLDFAGSEGQP